MTRVQWLKLKMFCHSPFLLVVLLLCLPQLDAQDLTVRSYNVWFDDRTGLDLRYRLILEDLSQADVDVICLQEVTPAFQRMIRERFRNSKFAIQGEVLEGYGNLTLTRLETVAQSYLRLPTRMQRKALKSTVKTVSGNLVIYNVHLDSMLDDTERRIEQVKTILADGADKRFLIVGDFNFGDDEAEAKSLERFTDPGRALKEPTFDIERNQHAKLTRFEHEPSRRIDRIISSQTIPQKDFRIFRNEHSDHFAIQSTVVLDRPGQ